MWAAFSSNADYAILLHRPGRPATLLPIHSCTHTTGAGSSSRHKTRPSLQANMHETRKRWPREKATQSCYMFPGPKSHTIILCSPARWFYDDFNVGPDVPHPKRPMLVIQPSRTQFNSLFRTSIMWSVWLGGRNRVQDADDAHACYCWQTSPLGRRQQSAYLQNVQTVWELKKLERGFDENRNLTMHRMRCFVAICERKTN